MRYQHYSSAMDAATNCDSVDDTKGRVRELLASPSSPAKDFVANWLIQKVT